MIFCDHLLKNFSTSRLKKLILCLINKKNGLISILDSKEKIKSQVATKRLQVIDLKHIILDASCINYVDCMGIMAIMWLSDQYKKIGIAIYLSYPKRMNNLFYLSIIYFFFRLFKMEIFEFLVAVRSSLKKFKVKYDPEFFFFKAVLFVFLCIFAISTTVPIYQKL